MNQYQFQNSANEQTEIPSSGGSQAKEIANSPLMLKKKEEQEEMFSELSSQELEEVAETKAKKSHEQIRTIASFEAEIAKTYQLISEQSKQMHATKDREAFKQGAIILIDASISLATHLARVSTGVDNDNLEESDICMRTLTDLIKKFEAQKKSIIGIDVSDMGSDEFLRSKEIIVSRCEKTLFDLDIGIGKADIGNFGIEEFSGSNQKNAIDVRLLKFRSKSQSLLGMMRDFGLSHKERIPLMGSSGSRH
jgi:hypothetical protein